MVENESRRKARATEVGPWGFLSLLLHFRFRRQHPSWGPLQHQPNWLLFFWSLLSRIIFLRHCFQHVPSHHPPDPTTAMHSNPLQSIFPSTWHSLGEQAPDSSFKIHRCSSPYLLVWLERLPNTHGSTLHHATSSLWCPLTLSPFGKMH